jgi:methyl-accepting chemotaxis protein
MNSIAEIIEDTEKLRKTIDGVNGRTQNLAASTEEIAASVEMVLNTAHEVKSRLKELENM